MSNLSSSAHTPVVDSVCDDSRHVYDISPSDNTPTGGRLTLVATPIGNLGDLSLRALDALREADLILCEDTRVTAKLLKAHNVPTPTSILHDHNEEERLPALLQRLRSGARIALVSDAGTPLVSDPGFRLTRAAIAEGLPVTGIPGANAAALALTLSGLPPQPFTFLGFPPPRSAARRTAFVTLRAVEQAGLRSTLIWYEAPHRLIETLEDMRVVFGDERPAAVGRELTKRFEEMVRGTLAELAEHFARVAPRGEITLLLGPPGEDNGSENLDTRLREALQTHSVKDAAALVAEIVRLPKRTVYTRALELSRTS